jgi:hypothetical protein
LFSFRGIEPAVDVGEQFHMIGATWGHYEIKSQLGKGGMGEVYQARDGNLGPGISEVRNKTQFSESQRARRWGIHF